MKIFSAAGDTSLFGLGAVSLLGWPINYWLATLAIIYAVMRIGVVAFDLYWKWKDRNEQEDRKRRGDGGAARPDRPDADGDDQPVEKGDPR